MAEVTNINLLDKWWKIVGAIGTFIFYATIMWIRIGDNTTAIKDIQTDFTNKIQTETDKRNTRVAQNDIKFEKLEREHDELLKQVGELEQQVFYLKGIIDSQNKSPK